MSNSIFDSYIRFPTSAFGDNYPVDTSYVRDCIVSNANHICDEAGQQRINFVTRTGQTLNGDENTADQFQRIIAWKCPVSVRSDGESYRIVFRVRGYCQAAVNIKVRVILAPVGRMSAAAEITSATYMQEVTTNSAADGWLTFSTDYVYLSQADVLNATQSLSVYNAVAGADRGGTTFCDTLLSVWYQDTTASSTLFYLTGLHAREYVGT